MTPTPWAAALVAVLAVSALLLPLAVVGLLGAALAGAFLIDARAARRAPVARRNLPGVLSRGVPAAFRAKARAPAGGRVRLRQATPPDLSLEPSESDDGLDARLMPRRRGRHPLPALAARVDGPLGLGRSYHRPGDEEDVLVYPDLPAARRIALAVRRGRFREQAGLVRGPLGLGTDLESVRDYLPDDDIRQLNWPATARLGRPMSNQYRVEQDRDVTCVVDTGRLMASPLGTGDPAQAPPGDRSGQRPGDDEQTRLDAALDACMAVALVADEVGDRCGAVAFDTEIRRLVRPRRRGAEAVVGALFDLEPRAVDSDYGVAFRTVEGTKRSLVMVFSDILEEVAAEPLLGALPVLARRHAVVVASTSDPDLEAVIRTAPERPRDVYAQSVALDVLAARTRVVARLRHAGCDVVEESPERLAAACVRAYLTQKARARL